MDESVAAISFLDEAAAKLVEMAAKSTRVDSTTAVLRVENWAAGVSGSHE